MKRHNSFVPLSREHHESLLLAVRLQQGRRALLRLWSHDPHWQAQFVVKYFDDELAAHFDEEETVVFPAVWTFLTDNTIIERLKVDHTEMREMVDFLRDPLEKKLECTLTRFGQLLESHIRMEEREFFPACEGVVPQDILHDIGRKLAPTHS